jgi:hypothetical protein
VCALAQYAVSYRFGKGKRHMERTRPTVQAAIDCDQVGERKSVSNCSSVRVVPQ